MYPVNTNWQVIVPKLNSKGRDLLVVSNRWQTQMHICKLIRWLFSTGTAFGALTLFVGRQEESDWVMRCWWGYLSGARCRLFACGPTYATASQNPIVSCLIWIQISFTFLLPAYPDCPGKDAIKMGLVVVVVSRRAWVSQLLLWSWVAAFCMARCPF